MEDASNTPHYYVPALEKGLDILECLASQNVPLTQAQLARALDRGPSELFRMLATLERRGYIERDPLWGAYHLTLRLFELGHTHSPLQGLLRAASRPMQALTEEVGESCHLSVIHRGQLIVLAQEESRTRIRLSVEVGGTFSLIHTVSGRVLLAALNEQMRQELFAANVDYEQLSAKERDALNSQLQRIQERGYDTAWGETTEGVSDIAVLVGTPTSYIKAALAIASLTRQRDAFSGTMLPALRRCAETISRAAGIVG